MKKLQKRIDIQAPPQRVYDYVTKPMNLPGIWPNLVSVSNVVAGEAGANEFDWVYEMGGIRFHGHSHTDDAQPGARLYVKNTGGIDSTFLWTFDELDGGGTRLTLDIEYSIPTPVVGKVAEALTAKANERDADTMLANLKKVLEQTTSVAAAAPAPAPPA